MGNTCARYLAPICAGLFLIASPALGQSSTISAPGRTPEQVIGNLVARCASQGNSVESASDRQMVCVRSSGIAGLLLFGTRSGAAPVYRDRFFAMPIEGGTSLIVTTTLDTMNAFGGANSRPMAISDRDRSTIVEVARGTMQGLPYSVAPPPNWNAPQGPPLFPVTPLLPSEKAAAAAAKLN